MERRRPSLLSRFRLTGAAVIFGVGVAGALLYGTVNSHYLGMILSRTLGPYTDALAERGFEGPYPDIWQRIAARHEVMILVEPAVGEAVAFDSRGRPLSPLSPALRNAPIRGVRTAADGTRVTLCWSLLSFRDRHLPLLFGLVLVVGAVVGSAFWFLQRQLRPLALLHRGVEAVARGDFATRVPVVRGDEIGEVAAAFNAMARRVGEMLDDRERLLADVSHELRSPLARMKVALELMPEGEKRDALARDVAEMSKLIAVLLERQELRSRTALAAPREVRLDLIAGEVVAAGAGRGPGVVLAEPPATAGARGVSVQGDAAMLRLLLRNLIDNAIKFSPPDRAPVEVRVEASGEEVLLRVLDDGIGIPPGAEERLFAPFVKLDPARGHGVGHGLGLNLCQRIVELHGGSIRLLPRRPRGTEVAVTLPRTVATGDRTAP